jgi:hypothetical protein
MSVAELNASVYRKYISVDILRRQRSARKNGFDFLLGTGLVKAKRAMSE